jgi:acetyl-CoA C-acetyltransferase
MPEHPKCTVIMDRDGLTGLLVRAGSSGTIATVTCASSGALDPRTPVIVGVGQASERLGEAGYQGLSPVELAAAAARAALADSGADLAAVARVIDTVAGVRQFEASRPDRPAPLGRADNYPRAVARRVGVDPGRAILEVVGGQSPQHLVTELAGAIAAGQSGGALVFGAEAISTVRHFLAQPAEARPDFTETVGGSLEDRGLGLGDLASPYRWVHGLTDPPSGYALLENARRSRLGLSRSEYAAQMGALFAPFTTVAAANPHAAAPTERTAEELVTPTGRNRPIADPYTRFIVARDQVNQGAAVLLLPAGTARDLGIAPEACVYLHGHADLTERDVLDRADLGASPASALAIRHAVEQAGISLDDLGLLDLYSCFPIAVLAVCDGLGLDPADPRGLTLTGGLPFFGGPGNNYSMHAIAELVAGLRARPGAFGLVGANGGILSKYSAAVCSTAPAPWRPSASRELQQQVAAWPPVPQATAADGPAVIESWTVRYPRPGPPAGVVAGRLDGSGARFLARADDADSALLELLSSGDPAGQRILARTADGINQATLARG